MSSDDPWDEDCDWFHDALGKLRLRQLEAYQVAFRDVKPRDFARSTTPAEVRAQANKRETFKAPIPDDGDRFFIGVDHGSAEAIPVVGTYRIDDERLARWWVDSVDLSGRSLVDKPEPIVEARQQALFTELLGGQQPELRVERKQTNEEVSVGDPREKYWSDPQWWTDRIRSALQSPSSRMLSFIRGGNFTPAMHLLQERSASVHDSCLCGKFALDTPAYSLAEEQIPWMLAYIKAFSSMDGFGTKAGSLTAKNKESAAKAILQLTVRLIEAEPYTKEWWTEVIEVADGRGVLGVHGVSDAAWCSMHVRLAQQLPVVARLFGSNISALTRAAVQKGELGHEAMAALSAYLEACESLPGWGHRCSSNLEASKELRQWVQADGMRVGRNASADLVGGAEDEPVSAAAAEEAKEQALRSAALRELVDTANTMEPKDAEGVVGPDLIPDEVLAKLESVDWWKSVLNNPVVVGRGALNELHRSQLHALLCRLKARHHAAYLPHQILRLRLPAGAGKVADVEPELHKSMAAYLRAAMAHPEWKRGASSHDADDVSRTHYAKILDRLDPEEYTETWWRQRLERLLSTDGQDDLGVWRANDALDSLQRGMTNCLTDSLLRTWDEHDEEAPWWRAYMADRGLTAEEAKRLLPLRKVIEEHPEYLSQLTDPEGTKGELAKRWLKIESFAHPKHSVQWWRCQLARYRSANANAWQGSMYRYLYSQMREVGLAGSLETEDAWYNGAYDPKVPAHERQAIINYSTAFMDEGGVGTEQVAAANSMVQVLKGLQQREFMTTPEWWTGVLGSLQESFGLQRRIALANFRSVYETLHTVDEDVRTLGSSLHTEAVLPDERPQLVAFMQALLQWPSFGASRAAPADALRHARDFLIGLHQQGGAYTVDWWSTLFDEWDGDGLPERMIYSAGYADIFRMLSGGVPEVEALGDLELHKVEDLRAENLTEVRRTALANYFEALHKIDDYGFAWDRNLNASRVLRELLKTTPQRAAEVRELFDKAVDERERIGYSPGFKNVFDIGVHGSGLTLSVDESGQRTYTLDHKGAGLLERITDGSFHENYKRACRALNRAIDDDCTVLVPATRYSFMVNDTLMTKEIEARVQTSPDGRRDYKLDHPVFGEMTSYRTAGWIDKAQAKFEPFAPDGTVMVVGDEQWWLQAIGFARTHVVVGTDVWSALQTGNSAEMLEQMRRVMELPELAYHAESPFVTPSTMWVTLNLYRAMLGLDEFGRTLNVETRVEVRRQIIRLVKLLVGLLSRWAWITGLRTITGKTTRVYNQDHNPLTVDYGGEATSTSREDTMAEYDQHNDDQLQASMEAARKQLEAMEAEAASRRTAGQAVQNAGSNFIKGLARGGALVTIGTANEVIRDQIMAGFGDSAPAALRSPEGQAVLLAAIPGLMSLGCALAPVYGVPLPDRSLKLVAGAAQVATEHAGMEVTEAVVGRLIAALMPAFTGYVQAGEQLLAAGVLPENILDAEPTQSVRAVEPATALNSNKDI